MGSSSFCSRSFKLFCCIKFISYKVFYWVGFNTWNQKTNIFSLTKRILKNVFVKTFCFFGAFTHAYLPMVSRLQKRSLKRKVRAAYNQALFFPACMVTFTLSFLCALSSWYFFNKLVLESSIRHTTRLKSSIKGHKKQLLSFPAHRIQPLKTREFFFKKTREGGSILLLS